MIKIWIFILLLYIFLLSGCIKNTKNDEQTTTPTTAPTITPTAAPISANADDWYLPIIETYAALDDDNEYTYYFFDVNGDGIKELFIGMKIMGFDYDYDFECIYAKLGDGYVLIMESEYFRNSLRLYIDNSGGYVIEKNNNANNPAEQYIYEINENNEAVLLNLFYLYGDYNIEERYSFLSEISMAVDGKEMEITFDEYNVYMEQYGMRGVYDRRKPRLIKHDWKLVKDYNN